MGFLNHAKTAWNGEVYCDWCGAYIKEHDGSGVFGAAGALLGRAIDTAKKNYCSESCRHAAQQAAAEKKADYEERKANGQLTATEQIKEDIAAPIKDAFSEMGGMVKDTMAEPMNEMKNQLADQMKQSFAGISKGFGMFGKKK